MLMLLDFAEEERYLERESQALENRECPEQGFLNSLSTKN